MANGLSWLPPWYGDDVRLGPMGETVIEPRGAFHDNPMGPAPVGGLALAPAGPAMHERMVGGLAQGARTLGRYAGRAWDAYGRGTPEARGGYMTPRQATGRHLGDLGAAMLAASGPRRAPGSFGSRLGEAFLLKRDLGRDRVSGLQDERLGDLRARQLGLDIGQAEHEAASREQFETLMQDAPGPDAPEFAAYVASAAARAGLDPQLVVRALERNPMGRYGRGARIFTRNLPDGNAVQGYLDQAGGFVPIGEPFPRWKPSESNGGRSGRKLTAKQRRIEDEITRHRSQFERLPEARRQALLDAQAEGLRYRPAGMSEADWDLLESVRRPLPSLGAADDPWVGQYVPSPTAEAPVPAGPGPGGYGPPAPEAVRELTQEALDGAWSTLRERYGREPERAEILDYLRGQGFAVQAE